MQIQEIDGLRILTPDLDCLLYSQSNNSYHEKIYLGIGADLNGFVDVLMSDIEGYEPKKEVDKLKKQQIIQDEDIILNMETTIELFEMMVAMTSTYMIGAKTVLPEHIRKTYNTLIDKGVKSIEDVPESIRKLL